MTSQHSAHSHLWLVGIVGMAVGLAMLLVVPGLKGVAGAVLLVALFHVLGAFVLLGSVYAVAPRRLVAALGRLRRARQGTDALDFGWSWGALNGPYVAAVALLGVALALVLRFPDLWPLGFLIALFGVSFFVGGVIMRTTKDPGWAALPLVNLLQGDHDRVLDAGCGAGRTTIALSRVLKDGCVVALDRFDATYIADGGRALLEGNLRKAGIMDKVEIATGDITHLPQADLVFDSAVSAHVIDHLGAGKLQGLKEIYRVLKPGGRLLMVVWVPGWMMFAVASFMSFFLTGKAQWKELIAQAGFALVDQGTLNGTWFVLLEKPR